MVNKTEIKVELNATEILKELWPVMVFAIIMIVVIGIGGYIFSNTLSTEIHMIYIMYIWFFSSLLIYLGAVALFFNDIKKMASFPSPSHLQHK